MRRPRDNSILDRLQLQYELKTEPVVKPHKSEVSAPAIKINKLKRGRPCKSRVESPQTASDKVVTKLIEAKNAKRLAKREKNWLKLSESIRESVYLTKVYNTNQDFFKTVGFKIDSRLVIGNVVDEFAADVIKSSSSLSLSRKGLRSWSVDQVSHFVSSIPGCEKFVELFVSQVDHQPNNQILTLFVYI